MRAMPIDAEMTTSALHDALAELGGQCIVQALHDLKNGQLHRTQQPALGVTYAHKIHKQEATLDFTQDAATLVRKVRALNPFPGASMVIEGVAQDQALKVWQAHALAEKTAYSAGTVIRADAHGLAMACRDGVLNITNLQKAGGQRLDAGAFLQGTTIAAGMKAL